MPKNTAKASTESDIWKVIWRGAFRAGLAVRSGGKIPHAVPSATFGVVKSGIRRFQQAGCIAGRVGLVGCDANADSYATSSL